MCFGSSAHGSFLDPSLIHLVPQRITEFRGYGPFSFACGITPGDLFRIIVVLGVLGQTRSLRSPGTPTRSTETLIFITLSLNKRERDK